MRLNQRVQCGDHVRIHRAGCSERCLHQRVHAKQQQLFMGAKEIFRDLNVNVRQLMFGNRQRLFAPVRFLQILAFKRTR